MRTETFYLSTGASLPRGEALRALIAAVYDTARTKRLFTTDDVFSAVQGYNPSDLRKTLANSKLIAVALRKVRNRSQIEPTTSTHWSGDEVCHARNKRVWRSNIVQD